MKRNRKIQHHGGTKVYQFGDGTLVQAVDNVDLPIAMGSKHVILNTDIVPSDIPLLLPRKSKKKKKYRCIWTTNSINEHKIRP